MRTVDLTPFLDQTEDRLLLGFQQPVDRLADRPTVLQTPGLSQSPTPAVRAHVGEVPRVRPPVLDRAVDQPQQLELGLSAHARGDRAEKPERFPGATSTRPPTP